jgi:putative cardiolipin synthase
MGVFIASPEAASRLAQAVMDNLFDLTYAVELDARGKLEWRYRGNGQRPDKEPDTGWWRRFTAGFYGVLPIEGQL